MKNKRARHAASLQRKRHDAVVRLTCAKGDMSFGFSVTYADGERGTEEKTKENGAYECEQVN